MASTTQKPESEMAEAQHGLPYAPPDNDDLFSFHSDQSAAEWMVSMDSRIRCSANM